MAICQLHGEFKQVTNYLLGKEFKPMCPKCEAEMLEKEQQADKDSAAERLAAIIAGFGIPDRFKECTLDNYHVDSIDQEKAFKAVKKYVSYFKTGKVSNPLFLCGSFGTGKTHLAVGVIKILFEYSHIKSALYTTTMRMIRDIRGSYHHKSVLTEQEVIDKYIECDILILDEVGLQNGTDNEKLLIYEVLNGRYEELKPTVIISNLPYVELKTYLGERVIDRLKGKDGVLAVFDWESERGNI